jgi:FKBP-type peptidyl-prolyl cis-trans isomerase
LLDIPNRPPPDVKAPPADATKTASGLYSKILVQGVGGRHPRSSSAVTVNYTGWTTDGKMFDSSVVHGQPATFTLDNVIPGWTEGVPLMFEGEKRRFWIPEELAYKGKSAPYGMLVFDIELLKIE